MGGFKEFSRPANPGALTGQVSASDAPHSYAPHAYAPHQNALHQNAAKPLAAQQNAGKFSRLLSLVVEKRQLALLVVVAIMVVAEVIEQALSFFLGELIHIYYDAFIFLVILPIVAWVLLRLLKQMDIEREQAQASSNLHTEFSQKLGDARSWDELVQQILMYPHQIAPEANITLFTVHPVDQTLQPEAACDPDGRITLKPEVANNPGSLPVGSLPQLLLQQDSAAQPAQAALVRAFRLRQENGAIPPLTPHRYDLPITHNGLQIGVIKLEFQPGMAPSADQIRALKAAAPVMGLALEGALLQQLAADQAAASQSQREEIAQKLHDTLAQNVGYLRLKLDQITGENAIREIGVILQELERMRSTADEAYQQVRNTLDELNPGQADNLVSTLFKQGRAISQRAGFSLRTSQVGRQHNLAASTRQQILYIVREALYNVEKHAKANLVHLQFIWLECELIIKITDDGVGFNPRVVPTEGHYGLWIMQQRAQEISGTLKIGPAADDGGGAPGTEVTLWVPCPPSAAPAEKFSDGRLARPEPVTSAVIENTESIS